MLVLGQYLHGVGYLLQGYGNALPARLQAELVAHANSVCFTYPDETSAIRSHLKIETEEETLSTGNILPLLMCTQLASDHPFKR